MIIMIILIILVIIIIVIILITARRKQFHSIAVVPCPTMEL